MHKCDRCCDFERQLAVEQWLVAALIARVKELLHLKDASQTTYAGRTLKKPNFLCAVCDKFVNPRNVFLGAGVGFSPDETKDPLREAAEALLRSEIESGCHTFGTSWVKVERAAFVALRAALSAAAPGGDAESGPNEEDCGCRTTTAQAECASAGCGFCKVPVP